MGFLARVFGTYRVRRVRARPAPAGKLGREHLSVTPRGRALIVRSKAHALTLRERPCYSMDRMGLTHLALEIANPAKPKRRIRVKLLVDSGAAYSVVPRQVLSRLGIKPTGKKTFLLADGTEIVRRAGAALFRFRREEGASTVIFGEPGDAVLLGVVTLEELGLILDPLRRDLRPMPLSLMHVTT